MFIHSCVDGCLNYSQVLAIMNKAALIICVQVLCGYMLSFLSGKYIIVDWLDQRVDVSLTF